MPRTKSESQDILGLFAFASAVGNLLQAEDRRKVKALYDNLVARYRDVCGQYQALARLNEELRQEVLDLRGQNDKLQRQMAIEKPSK